MPPSAVEGFAYPGAAKILADQGVTVKSGDGNIRIVSDCHSGENLLMVYSRITDPATPICFRATGPSGYLSLEIPKVYSIKGDDHTTKATLSTNGTVTQIDIPKNLFQPVGEGASPEGSAVLLELVTSGGPAATPVTSEYPAVGKINVGLEGRAGSRGCTATLVNPLWALTAAGCFTDNPASLTRGRPSATSTFTVGGAAIGIAEVVPQTGRDAALVRLDSLVPGVAPVKIATAAPVPGDSFRIPGFGRTAAGWAPANPRTVSHTVGAVSAIGIDSAPASGDSTLCAGDAGAPLLRTRGGTVEIAGVVSRSWQGGCLGEAPGGTGAVSTRVDDLGDWVKKALDLDWNTCIQYPPGTGRTLCGPILTKYLELGGPATVGIPTTDTTATPVQPGKYAHFASPGSNTANTSIYWSAATGAHLVTGGTRSVWADNGWENGWLGFPITEESPNLTGTRTGFQGGFVATHQPTAAASAHHYALDNIAVTAGDFTGDGHADAVTIDNDGYLWLHPATTGTTLGDPVLLWPSSGWKGITKITAGDFTGDGKTDLVAIWGDGQLQVYPGNANGTFQPSTALWGKPDSLYLYKDAKEIFAGDFTGDGKTDLGVLWNGGSLWLAPGNNTGRLDNGLDAIQMWPDNIFLNARQLIAGDHTGDGKTDMGVIWSSDGFWMQPGDGQGHITSGVKMWPDNSWSGARDAASADFDANGKPDVVSIWPDGTLHLYPDLKPL
ncbi:hypothetical protein GCM10010505_19440 [Kitasatospora aburaviensis]